MTACKCGVSSLHCICWTNSVQISESSVVSAAASADRESTEAGMGMPEALSGGLGVSSPAAPSTTPVFRAWWAYHQNVSRGVYPDALAEFDRWLAEVKAEAWDEGREQFGRDLMGPLREDGTRESTPNPHKTP